MIMNLAFLVLGGLAAYTATAVYYRRKLAEMPDQKIYDTAVNMCHEQKDKAAAIDERLTAVSLERDRLKVECNELKGRCEMLATLWTRDRWSNATAEQIEQVKGAAQ